MCGIAGRVNALTGAPVEPQRIEQMCRLLAHRGPDGQGVFAEGSVGLGHRRLAIIDLSTAAGQPMQSPDRRFTLTFNGEIYNFRELRDALVQRGYRFRTHSDTEVLLASYEADGANCLAHLRGMFAFAIWDAHERTLFMARDRVGKKPLYYRQDRDGLAFASEPKSFLADTGFAPAPDHQALALYLAYGYIPAPWSAFEGVRQLPAGHFLTFDRRGACVERYWKLRYQPKQSLGEAAALEKLEHVLSEAVRLRMVSDVPLGAFLSGGIDSGTVVALMARTSGSRIKTFSIGFDDQHFDELAYARQVAERFETEHHEFVVRPDAAGILPSLAWYYGEPFADSSAIPTYYVAKLTREHVTVALNGDAGDESFAGYSRYIEPDKAATYGRIPRPLRQAVAWGLRQSPVPWRSDALVAKAQRWSEVMGGTPRERYVQAMMACDVVLRRRLCSPEWLSRTEAVVPERVMLDAFDASDALDGIDAMLDADVETYLPGDILKKVDIAAMANGLEGRSPFLDHHVLEFAASLPSELKLRQGERKYLLKKFAATLLPPDLLTRPKKGFSVPLARWLREDLREMVHDVLLDGRASGRGVFRRGAVEQLVREHETAVGEWHVQIYAMLMLELWFRGCVDGQDGGSTMDVPSDLAVMPHTPEGESWAVVPR